VLGTPTTEEIKNIGGKQIKVEKLPKYQKQKWRDYFKGKINDELYFDLVDKLLVYEPNKRLTPYQAMCHAFFDELKKKDVQLPENKQLPTHLFEFKQCEIDFDKESINRIMEQINEK